MEHPIGNMMKTTMENIKEMVDVNTVVGEPIFSANNMTIIPISRVSVGFLAGGGDYQSEKGRMKLTPPEELMPFAGGSGAGISVQPVGFLVVGPDHVKMLPAQSLTVADRIVELLPQMLGDVKNMFTKGEQEEALQ